MGLVITFWPFVTETTFQITGEIRFVVDSKLKPVTLVGHVKITFVPEGVIVSCG
jgi:hypothetical protein